ncbi:hypothetical protein BGZ51_002639, partial [Haplosporangium sp. Z 767]
MIHHARHSNNAMRPTEYGPHPGDTSSPSSYSGLQLQQPSRQSCAPSSASPTSQTQHPTQSFHPMHQQQQQHILRLHQQDQQQQQRPPAHEHVQYPAQHHPSQQQQYTPPFHQKRVLVDGHAVNGKLVRSHSHSLSHPHLNFTPHHNYASPPPPSQSFHPGSKQQQQYGPTHPRPYSNQQMQPVHTTPSTTSMPRRDHHQQTEATMESDESASDVEACDGGIQWTRQE